MLYEGTVNGILHYNYIISFYIFIERAIGYMYSFI